MKDICVGIDVSKDTLEVGAGDGIDRRTFPNTDGGIALMVKWVKKHKPALIVLEATGGLERRAAVSLCATIHNPIITEPITNGLSPQGNRKTWP